MLHPLNKGVPMFTLKILTIGLISAVALMQSNFAFAKQEMVAICHKPGTPAQQTLVVALPAVQAHLGHGDSMGACASLPPPPSDPEPSGPEPQ